MASKRLITGPRKPPIKATRSRYALPMRKGVTPGELRAVMITVARVLEAPRDRLGRLDIPLSEDAMKAREILRNFAVKYGITGGARDVIEQAAKVIRAVLQR